jgi:glutathione peroxidase
MFQRKVEVPGGLSMLRRMGLALASVFALSAPVLAAPGDVTGMTDQFSFQSIDGGEIRMADWAGQPVLVANTASLCGFSGQYADLQALYDQYRDQGLIVLAIPSDDFRQELGSDAEVKDYCEMTFGLDLPMSTITHVLGDEAHPFYQWMAAEHGFVPRWNFNKVLIGADGAVLGTWGSMANPSGPEIVGAVESALGR